MLDGFTMQACLRSRSAASRVGPLSIESRYFAKGRRIVRSPGFSLSAVSKNRTASLKLPSVEPNPKRGLIVHFCLTG